MEMTENEKKKQYLWSYREAVRQMERSELKIREMRLNRVSPSAVADGMPRAHGGNDLSGYAALLDQEERRYLFFVKYFSLKKASEFPFFSKGFSLPSAGIMHPCA